MREGSTGLFAANVNRQTGMYRVTRNLTEDQAENLVKEACRSDSRCLRTILWGIEVEHPPDFLPSSKSDPSFDQTGQKRASLPFLCLEACNLLVAAARTTIRSRLDDCIRCRTLVTMDGPPIDNGVFVVDGPRFGDRQRA